MGTIFYHALRGAKPYPRARISLMQTSAYAHRVELAVPFEKAIERTQEALREQGFGVLTEIDIQAKLKETIGADFRRYVLGACSPPLAHRALQAELEVGVLLPCNVVVYETDSRA
jgi:uncharacterized protein (DUF302 family)